MRGSGRPPQAPIGRLPRILDRIADELLSPEECLYLSKGHTVMMWRRDEGSLRRGEYPFVVGVDLTDQRPVAISAHRLSTLTPHFEGTSATRLEEALSELQRFRIERRRYHDALNGLKPEEWLYLDMSGHSDDVAPRRSPAEAW